MDDRVDIPPKPQVQRDNRSMLRKLLVVSAVMFGFGWALVPLYRKICEITGVNVVTLRDADAERAAKNTQVDMTRSVIVEFDANTQGPWQFRPQVSHLEVHPGELVQVAYDLVNLRDRSVAGQAIPSYAPLEAARHVQKLECFCFTQQTLAAGETRRFAVVFFIDPRLPPEVSTVTLSYTFFEVAGAVVDPGSRRTVPNG